MILVQIGRAGCLAGQKKFDDARQIRSAAVAARPRYPNMLEVCPSIADTKPTVEIHPLSIGGKADPVRLVFTAGSGKAVNASIVDLGNRFRLIVNQVNMISPEHALPKLPVARAVWVPEPNLKVAATAWIAAGGSHHTALSPALTLDHVENFADMAGSGTAGDR